MGLKLLSTEAAVIVGIVVLTGLVMANPLGLFAAPTEASLSVATTSPVYEGSEAIFTLNFIDRNPSNLERYSVYTPYEITWFFGDNAIETDRIIPDKIPYQTTLTKKHAYVQNRFYRPTAMVKDLTAGGTIRALTSITILNAPPQVSLEAFDMGGGDWRIVGKYTDPGIGDTHMYFLDFGDGKTILDRAPTVWGSGTVEVAHHYEGVGSWTENPCSERPEKSLTIRFSVMDSDRAAAATEKKITVSGLPSTYEERLAWVRDSSNALETGKKDEHELKEMTKSLDRALVEASTGSVLAVQQPESPQHNYLKSFDRVRKAVHFAEKLSVSEKEGFLCALNFAVRDKTKERLQEAVAQVGLENKNVLKAQERFDQGLQLLAEGKYEDAINKFKSSLSKSTKALSKDVPFSYSAELESSAADVGTLIELSPEASKELNNAAGELLKAKEAVEKDNFNEAAEHVKKAVGDLEKIGKKYSLDTEQITTDLLLDMELAVSLKLDEAEEIIVGPEKSSVKAGQALSEAISFREAGNFNKAIEKFSETYREASKAIKEGGKSV